MSTDNTHHVTLNFLSSDKSLRFVMTITFSGRTETVSCSSCPSPVILAVDAEHCDRSVTLSKTPTVLSNFHGTKILFLAQCFVILTLDLLCILRLAAMSKRPNTCEENTTYLTILSSTIGYLLPPPRASSPDTNTQVEENCGNDEVDGSVDAGFRSPVGNRKTPINCSTLSHSEDSHGIVWNCHFFRIRHSHVVFYTQIIIVVTLVICSSLQLIIREPTCEEKTAHFIIISSCLTYLLPPITT